VTDQPVSDNALPYAPTTLFDPPSTYARFAPQPAGDGAARSIGEGDLLEASDDDDDRQPPIGDDQTMLLTAAELEAAVLDAEPAAPLELDPVSAAAVDVARAAAEELAPGSVGEHLGVSADAPYVVTHSFAATLPGYDGWNWAVTVARVSDSDHVTVDEVVLLPGAGALLAPQWVPWSERMRPGDLTPGDIVAPREDDPRLVPAYADPEPSAFEERDDAQEPQVEEVVFELGLGRVHVMSREGRLEAADRWQNGDGGPGTEMARLAPAHCGTCGFYLSLAGSLQAAFGVCGNEMALSDGRVVSVEHGCGAHSEAVIEPMQRAEPVGTVYDDGDDIDPIA
jgi:hypothetical protein